MVKRKIVLSVDQLEELSRLPELVPHVVAAARFNRFATTVELFADARASLRQHKMFFPDGDVDPGLNAQSGGLAGDRRTKVASISDHSEQSADKAREGASAAAPQAGHKEAQASAASVTMDAEPEVKATVTRAKRVRIKST
ncbi:hypothetical protein [Microviridae Bog5275_51]|uniref:hypothetical protein n=1 Tax=Microviridae Bog5275_51 TaxID=1655648 RepID=UPI00063D5E0C|nr:hypothetical protein [Microviridae Bog5275_51]AKI26880.1 hypothetical protein [Microviridae Bog5275_51]